MLARTVNRWVGSGAIAAAFVMAATQWAGGAEISVTQWGTGLYGAPYAVAMEKGFFRQAGIDITGILGSVGGGTTVRNVLASETPYGEVALSAAVAAYREGLPVVIVNAGTRNVAEFVWVTKPDSPIKTINDLAGQKVSYTAPKSVTEMLLILSLRAAKVDINSVKMVPSGGYGPGLTLLDTGAVVAAPIIEPAWTEKKERYRAVFFVKDMLPPMTSTVGITTREFARTHAKELAAIIAGRRAGVDYIYAHPAEAGQIVAKANDLAPKVAEESVANMARAGAWSPGDIDLQAFQRMVDGLKVIGEAKEDIDWPKVVDRAYLPADLQGK